MGTAVCALSRIYHCQSVARLDPCMGRSKAWTEPELTIRRTRRFTVSPRHRSGTTHPPNRWSAVSRRVQSLLPTRVGRRCCSTPVKPFWNPCQRPLPHLWPALSANLPTSEGRSPPGQQDGRLLPENSVISSQFLRTRGSNIKQMRVVWAQGLLARLGIMRFTHKGKAPMPSRIHWPRPVFANEKILRNVCRQSFRVWVRGRQVTPRPLEESTDAVRTQRCDDCICV